MVLRPLRHRSSDRILRITQADFHDLGYGSQAQIASPGPGKPRTNRGPLGHGSTPQQSQSMPYPGASPQMGRPSPPPQFHNVGNMLADLDPDQMRSDQKREGNDWFAVFNPNVRRVLDVSLVHNLVHESVVCCVRFSRDGRYVATGCNRSAQIFDVNSGNQVTKLQDDTVDKDGDLYIRSVCFSPDGNFLATGAEDKLIRVRSFLASLHTVNKLTPIERCGISKIVLFGLPFPATSKISTLSILLATEDTLHLAVAIIQSRSGILIKIVRY